MTDLLIERLHTRAAVTGPDDDARVRSLLADLTGRRLEEALAESALPEGDWCLRRLDVPLRLDVSCADSALSRRWARGITEAISTAIDASARGAGSDVVHYPRRIDAVVDVVAELAVGDRSREWAWRSVGVLTHADPDPASSPAQAALAALARDPAAAVHATTAAAERAGLPALHRLFGESGWRALAAIALDAAGHAPGRWLGATRLPEAGTSSRETIRVRSSAARNPSTAEAATLPHPAGSAPGADETATAAPYLAEGILARSSFARAWRASRLRPGTATAHAWTLLAAAEAEPTLLRRPVAAATLALVSAMVIGQSAAAAPALGSAHRRADGSVTSPATSPAGPAAPPSVTPAEAPVDRGTRSRSTPPTPAGTPEATAVSTREVAGPVRIHDPAPDRVAPDPAPATSEPPTPYEVGAPTAYGGLVYLLATAEAAGIPDDLLLDELVSDRPLQWSLVHLYRRLCSPAAQAAAAQAAADPAPLALAGLPIVPWHEPEPTAAQAGRLDRYAARWAAMTAARLGAGGDDPVAAVAALTARHGWVEAVPGWVEFRLRLDDTDLAVRRSGLDIDPGYVPWLGVVVVIRYG